jgi:hypothetical protein
MLSVRERESHRCTIRERGGEGGGEAAIRKRETEPPLHYQREGRRGRRGGQSQAKVGTARAARARYCVLIQPSSSLLRLSRGGEGHGWGGGGEGESGDVVAMSRTSFCGGGGGGKRYATKGGGVEGGGTFIRE